MGDIIKMKWADQLKLEGILCKGYGVLPKYAMCDHELPLVSKAIYAYFCSLAGSGDSTFPGRDTIVARLRINKESYYKYLKFLEEQGYITVTKSTNALGQFSHNIYKIEEFPKKFKEERKRAGTVAYDGIKSAGYGQIARAVMMDDRLEAKAKAIYAYFACFTGPGEAAFPEVKTILYHLGLTYKTYHKYYSSLIKLNFIKVTQRHKDGRLDSNFYTLMTNPDEAQAISIHESSKTKVVSFSKPQGPRQVGKKPDTDKPVAAQGVHQVGKIPDTGETLGREALSQIGKFPDEEFPDREKQDMEIQDGEEQLAEKQDKKNVDTINPSFVIPSSSSPSSLDHQSIYPSETERIDAMDRRQKRKYLLDSLGFPQAFRDTTNFEDVMNLINLVVITLEKRTPTIRVGSRDLPREEVVETLVGLELECYEYVAAQMQNTTRKIVNPVAYYLTALYNSADTIGVCMKQLENDDFCFPPDWNIGS